MRTLVEDVLEVARLDSASERAELQEIALGEFVTRRVRRSAPGRRGAGRARDARSPPTRAGWSGSSATCWPTPPSTASRPVEVTVEGRVHPGPRPRARLPRGAARRGAEPLPYGQQATGRATGHGLGLTIAAGQARVLGARLTFRNVAPGEPADAPATERGGGGAVAAGARADETGSYPMLPAVAASARRCGPLA